MQEIAIHSHRFGEVKAIENEVLEFPEGLVGLASYHRFAEVEPTVAGSPFRCLVSLEDSEVGFAVADPSKLFSNYEVDLTGEREVLDIQSDDDVQVLVILTVPEDPIRTTANLLAPLVLNTRTKVGRQLVLADSRYSTRHPIIAARNTH